MHRISLPWYFTIPAGLTLFLTGTLIVLCQLTDHAVISLPISPNWRIHLLSLIFLSLIVSLFGLLYSVTGKART